jgi:hypothetical protein
MKRLLALLLLPGGTAFAQDRPLPSAADVAAAYFEWEADVCRALIDVCETAIHHPTPDGVSELRCRAGRSGFATCRFAVFPLRCTAHFVGRAVGAARDWATDWSNLPSPVDRPWLVAWTTSPDPRGPRIRCRSR